MAQPMTTTLKLQYIFSFTCKRATFCSFLYELQSDGLRLRAWGGNRITISRVITWDMIENASKATIEAFIVDALETTHQANVQPPKGKTP